MHQHSPPDTTFQHTSQASINMYSHAQIYPHEKFLGVWHNNCTQPVQLLYHTPRNLGVFYHTYTQPLAAPPPPCHPHTPTPTHPIPSSSPCQQHIITCMNGDTFLCAILSVAFIARRCRNWSKFSKVSSVLPVCSESSSDLTCIYIYIYIYIYIC